MMIASATGRVGVEDFCAGLSARDVRVLYVGRPYHTVNIHVNVEQIAQMLRVNP